MRKPTICLCENKDADQLRGNREADQRLCFRYTDSTFPFFLNPKFQASSNLLCLYSPVCVGPGQKPKLLVFSRTGSNAFSIVFLVHMIYGYFCLVFRLKMLWTSSLRRKTKVSRVLLFMIWETITAWNAEKLRRNIASLISPLKPIKK